MELFGRTGGYWLFWTTFIYFWVGMFDIFVYNFTRTEFIQVAWIIVMSLPLYIKPLARYFNMKCVWEA